MCRDETIMATKILVEIGSSKRIVAPKENCLVVRPIQPFFPPLEVKCH